MKGHIPERMEARKTGPSMLTTCINLTAAAFLFLARSFHNE